MRTRTRTRTINSKVRKSGDPRTSTSTSTRTRTMTIPGTIGIGAALRWRSTEFGRSRLILPCDGADLGKGYSYRVGTSLIIARIPSG